MSKLEYKKLNALFAERDARYQEIYEEETGKLESNSINSLQAQLLAHQKSNDEFIEKLLREMHQLH